MLGIGSFRSARSEGNHTTLADYIDSKAESTDQLLEITNMALPISVAPLLILLPAAVLLGITVDVTVASFKKHL